MVGKVIGLFLLSGIYLLSFDSFYTTKKVKNSEFEKLVKVYANKNIEYPNLKAITLAMMILESGRGKSELAQKHKNFAGLKYRKIMNRYATKVRYGDGDGDNSYFYCKFSSHSKFIDGFWAFLDRAPYRGWREKTYSPKAFLKKIAPIYCPYNKQYVSKVLSLVPEATRLLQKYKEPVYKLASIN